MNGFCCANNNFKYVILVYMHDYRRLRFETIDGSFFFSLIQFFDSRTIFFYFVFFGSMIPRNIFFSNLR